MPHINKNLLSVYHFSKDNNVFFEFHPSFFCVKDLFLGAILHSSKRNNGLYPMHSLKEVVQSSVAYLGERVSLDQWRSRLGHPTLCLVHQVVSKNNLTVLNNKSSSVCNACQLGRSYRLPFHLSSAISKCP